MNMVKRMKMLVNSVYFKITRVVIFNTSKDSLVFRKNSEGNSLFH